MIDDFARGDYNYTLKLMRIISYCKCCCFAFLFKETIDIIVKKIDISTSSDKETLSS